MAGKRSFGVIAAVLLAALLGAACSSSSKTSSSTSSSSSSSNGDKAAFCKFNTEVNDKLSTATSAKQALEVFKDLESGFDSYLANAPSEIKADARLQVDAARAAIKNNDASSVPNNDQVRAAGEHVDSFCGQKSSSSSFSSPSPASTDSPSAQGACGLLDLNAIGSATNLTWQIIDSSSSTACTIQADNGNTVAISVASTSGQTAAALQGGKSRCDSGTAHDVDVADGGFVCQVSGVNTAMAVYAGSEKLVAAAAVTFNNANDSDVQQALVALLKSFQGS